MWSVYQPTPTERGRYRAVRSSRIPRRADIMNHRAGIMPMYSMEGSAKMNVDASCRRGYGGYANEPVRGQTQPRLFVNIADSGIRSLGPSNVQWGQFTIQPAQVHRMFGPPDQVTRMCNVLPGGSNRFYTKGWRRISNELLQRFQGHTLPWLWARDNIPQGRGSVEHKKRTAETRDGDSELLLPYRGGGVHRNTPHSTVPPLC